MESTESISKGCFIFKNRNTQKKPKSRRTSIFCDRFTQEPWYTNYQSMWLNIEKRIHNIRRTTQINILNRLMEFIKNAHEYNCNVPLPAAVLITGINQPDHAGQLNNLGKELNNKVTPHVAILFAHDCSNIKNAVENMVMQFILHLNDVERYKPIRKYQCNLSILKSWYENLYSEKNTSSPSKRRKTKPAKKPLVILMPDFECFNASILQDFILLLSGYSSNLPFVLLFGVATSLHTVHKTLPHHVTSKMSLKMFHSQKSLDTLYQILDEIILDPSCPFHLSGPALKLLSDVFLFYDLSIEGFINSFKFCMFQHYSNISPSFLCCDSKDVSSAINDLSKEDIESLRRLPSFRPYVESQNCQQRIHLLLDDNYVKTVLPELLINVHDYLKLFHVHLEILYELISRLPRTPLGKQLHELYIRSMTLHITQEQDYKECVQLLHFLSRKELKERLYSILEIVNRTKSTESKHCYRILDEIKNTLVDYLNKLECDDNIEQNNKMIDEDFSLLNIGRTEMRQMLLEKSKQKKPNSKYDSLRQSILEYFTSILQRYLYPATSANLPLYELFIFSDLDSVKGHIIGTPRAALHTALNNPNHYLQCSCCEIESKDAIIPTMPDICIAYKLHLECGRLINLYDWLLAFKSVLTSKNLQNQNNSESDKTDSSEIEPEIQARFTNCVAELQHIGFVKSSNRKTDHIIRLTW